MSIIVQKNRYPYKTSEFLGYSGALSRTYGEIHDGARIVAVADTRRSAGWGKQTQPAPSTLEKRITGFLSLEEGWHFGDGSRISEVAVAQASRLARLLNIAGAEIIEAFPELDGGVMLSAYKGENQLDVIIPHKGLFEVFVIADNTETRTLIPDYDAAIAYIRGLNWLTNRSYAYYTHSITAGKREDTTDLRSETVALAVYPSLISTAQLLAANIYAITSMNSMDRA